MPAYFFGTVRQMLSGFEAAAGLAGSAVGAVAGGVVRMEVRRFGRVVHPGRSTLGASVVTGGTFVLLARRFGPSPSFGVYAVFAAGLVVLGAVDLECHRLPNRVLKPTAASVGVLMALDALLAARWTGLGAAIGAGVVAGGAMWVVWWRSRLGARTSRGSGEPPRSGLGFGDVRLAALVGAGAAWAGTPPEALLLASVALVVACLSGLFVALGTLLLGGGRMVRFPIGPCLAVGALWTVLWGPAAIGAVALR
jgi:leader peptidase (prepilin peptidase)/N-methyltransferase